MPDAPAPVRDSHGNEVPPWRLSVRYETTTDLISLTFDQEASDYSTQKHLALDFAPTEVEQCLDQVRRLARGASARRLF